MNKKEMIQEVCNNFGVKPDDIYSLRRDKNTVSAKKAIYYVLRQSGLSFSQIGRIVNKDHQTVLITLRSMSNDLIKYATSIYNKYIDMGIKEELKLQNTILNQNRKKIIDLLNRNYTMGQIIDETKLSRSYVEEQINYFLTNGLYKKVPNYHTGGVSICFYDKNKKCEKN